LVLVFIADDFHKGETSVAPASLVFQHPQEAL